MTQVQSSPIELTSAHVEHTLALGRALAALLRAGDMIGLCGSLGAGKTQFVRGLAEGLGISGGAVSSPTFVLMQEYPAAAPLIHIDAYRIGGLSDLESMGWSDELFDGAISVIEWADRVEDQLPSDRLMIEIEHIGENERRMTIQPYGRWCEQSAALRLAVESAVG